MIAALATRFGPATCGCVPSYHWDLSYLVTPGYDAMRGKTRPEPKGWPQCPICHGSGIDPRIPVPAAVSPCARCGTPVRGQGMLFGMALVPRHVLCPREAEG